MSGSQGTPAVRATGIGSWPGTDVREALRVVRGELTGAVPEGVQGVPYLPELPDRGPGADMVGRTSHLLVDLPVDLAPQGWRLVDRPGRDHDRAGAWWGQDLDELAEAFDGWSGPLKVQVAGPWTLASELWLPLGDRVLSDRGATRDLVGSLAEGVAGHVATVRRLVPAAEVVLQLDEPSLTTVASGRVRSASGYSVLRTPEEAELVGGLREVVEAARGAGAVQVAIHSCAQDVPLDLLRRAGVGAVSLDVGLLRRPGWEGVAGLLDTGVRLWAGVLPSASGVSGGTGSRDHVEGLLLRWRELGLPAADLLGLTLTPTCGLAAATPEEARAATAGTVRAAALVAEAAAG
ncbi:methionine synthase [Ornithinimicrobium sp. W1665]|uniref:methionine synthase n=1 Tax=Ornithinimicrobium sp. W1665 TaxID=3416666 RepID=UPI003CF4960D